MEVISCSGVGEALERIKAARVNLLITDSKVSETGLAGFLAKVEATSAASSLSCIVVIAGPGESPDISGVSPSLKTKILLKPFDRGALVAMVRANLKTIPQAGSRVLRVESLTLNPGSYDVHLDAERIHLTTSEFKLLFELMSNPDVILSREHLIQKVQGEGIAVIDRAVDTHVFSLRKKLCAMGERIETVRGSGYRLRSDVR